MVAFFFCKVWIAPLAIAAMTLIAADNMAMAFTVPIFYVIFQCVVEYVGFGGLCRKNNCNFDYVKTSARAKKYFTSVLSLYIVAYSLAVVGNYELTRALISLPAGIALSIAAVFIGAVIQYFIYKAIYKKPISKYSQSGELKKAM